jgi:glycosyltransferase involved in cell wall biosynthesis
MNSMKIAYILPVNMKRYGYSKDNFLQTHFSVEIAREVAAKGHDVELHVFWDETTTYIDKNLKVYFYRTDLNLFFKRDFTEISLELLDKKFDEHTVIHFHEPMRLFFFPFMLKHHNLMIIEHHGLGFGNPFPRYSLGLGDETIILFAGRICQAKGIRELIKAFEMLKEQQNNIRLVLAGPLHEKRLKPLVEKYWIGFQNTQELQKWFTASDIFCLPTYYEAFAIILLEALYNAKPVITTDVPGIKEWFPPENAIFIPPQDAESLKNAMYDFIAKKKLTKINGNSRQIVLENYTWEKVCQRYIDIYRSCSAS